MDITFLQANIMHCARAQDLLVQSMAQCMIKIAIVAEPYVVPARDDWVGDHDDLVAIIAPSATGSPPFDKVAKGRGCVLAILGGIAVIGVYFSPNRSLAEFEQMLVEVGVLVRQVNSYPVLVAGDFNAKSTAWGSPATDVRGEVLEEWAVSLGLVILNRGSENTCVRRQGGSIVDITLASPHLANRVQDWRVLVDEETLSDHKYIRYSVPAPTASGRETRSPTEGGPRWVLGRLEREVAKEAAIVEAWVAGSDSVVEVDEEAVRLDAALTRVCDASMPRAKSFPPRRRVHWWHSELRDLRRACVVTRRHYTRQRRRRVRDQSVEDSLYETYRSACIALQVAIAQAKEKAWEEWLATLDRDPWGRPYRVVRQKLRPWAPPLTSSLQPQLLERVVDTLFPQRGEWVPPPMTAPELARENEVNVVPPVTEVEFEVAVLKLRSKNTAPGLDGVPGRALVVAVKEMGEHVKALFTACLERGQFPQVWKTGKLVLLRKDGRPADMPSAYRPIVLLGEVSKLFERVLATRLAECMEPGLHEAQFGFRRGRSTLGAIARVRNLAEEAVSRGGVMWAVSLDISNAFNALPWETVKAALKYHGVPPYLQAVVADYFTGRAVEYPTRDGWGRKAMTCGVPQGSVLGPLLWNIGYDWVLRGATLPGIGVTCYADDTLVSACGSGHREAARLATAGVAQIVCRIRALGLEVALNKSEALVFHGPRNAPPPGAAIMVGGTSITVGLTMKYLGIVLDGRWKFEEHFKRLAPKLVAQAGALARLLPNLGGPGGACRRLYTGVVRSMALYGAPIWADALSARNMPLLRRPQRVMALRAARAYRTVSHTGACVLAGSPPWDLDAEVLSERYWQAVAAQEEGLRPHPREVAQWRDEARDELFRRWKERLEVPGASREIVEAIRPILREWVERKHGVLSYHMTQVLTGHGCFAEYLCRILGREPTADCHHCSGAVDTAQHTRAECPAWAEPRAALSAAVGRDLSLPALAIAIVGGEESWNAVDVFSSTVMLGKEAAEREREEDPSSQPIRRKRHGRRRRAYLARMPQQ